MKRREHVFKSRGHLVVTQVTSATFHFTWKYTIKIVQRVCLPLTMASVPGPPMLEKEVDQKCSATKLTVKKLVGVAPEINLRITFWKFHTSFESITFRNLSVSPDCKWLIHQKCYFLKIQMVLFSFVLFWIDLCKF